MNVTSAMRPGANLIAVAATNGADSPNPAGLIGLVTVKLQDGRTLRVPTDGSWEAAEKVTQGWNATASATDAWTAAMELGPLGMPPWGDVESPPAAQDVFPDATVIARWLAKDGVPPDFSADHPLRHIHRQIGEVEVYFVANGAAESVESICSFRVAGKQPELWHPETGRITPLPAYEMKDGRTRVPLRFGPTEAVFVVFRHPGQAADRVVSIRRDGRELLPKAAPTPPAGSDLSSLDLVRGEICQPGTYVFKTADGRSREIKCGGLAAPLEIGGPWEVSFDPKWGGPSKVTFEKLDDWSKRPEEGIKYYSGTATYRKTLRLGTEALRRPDARWYLDLGRVAVMAEITLNGKDFGILWKPPYRADVTGALKPGDNAMEVKVVNLWVNRQIGDEQLPEDSDRNPNGTLKEWPKWVEEGKPSPTGRYSFTSWRLWKKGDPLQQSGLLGPVMLRQAVRFDAK
jgi:hypothetical protein